MTEFGSSGAPGGQHPDGRDTEEQPQGRILFKDNRRIDPKTGKPRTSAARSGAEAPGDAGSAGAAGAGGAGDVAAAGANAGAAAGAGSGAAAGTGAAAGAAASGEELAAARNEAAERTADLQRLSAEYANYRKRVERDKQAATVSGKAAVVLELLAVLDDLDRAEQHGDLTGGFKNVADKLTGTLNRLGLAHYGAEGDEFDPNVHEAVQFATSTEVEHPTVTTVLRLGYRFEERVLRPAVVIVTGPEHESAAPGETGDDGAEAPADPDAERPQDGATDQPADRPRDAADVEAAVADEATPE